MFSVFTNLTEMHAPFLSAVDASKEPRWAASVALVSAVTHLPRLQLGCGLICTWLLVLAT